MKARVTFGLAVAVAVVGMIVGAAIAQVQDAPKTLKGLRTTAKIASADEKAPGADVKCPVSGKPVNPEATVDFEECKVYFCCNNCPKTFAKTPARFGAKAHHQMVQTEQLKQVACPFTGKPLNPETEMTIAGVDVSFCCNNCKGKVEKTKEEARVGLVFKDTKKGFKLAKDVENSQTN